MALVLVMHLCFLNIAFVHDFFKIFVKIFRYFSTLHYQAHRIRPCDTVKHTRFTNATLGRSLIRMLSRVVVVVVACGGIGGGGAAAALLLL